MFFICAKFHLNLSLKAKYSWVIDSEVVL